MARRVGRPFHRGLDRRQVLHAALGVLHREGAAGLTMRRVAGQLDVEAASLYTHVRSKDDLVDGVLDLVLDQIRWDPRPPDEWREELVDGLGAYRRTLLDHPYVVPLVTQRSSRSSGQTRLVSRAIELLEAGGCDLAVAVSGSVTLTAFILGFVHQEVGRSADVSPEVLTEFPVLQRALGALLATTVDQRFQAGLDTILDGLSASGRHVR